MTATASESLWCARIGERLAKNLGPRRYTMWFDRTARFEFHPDEDALDVLVPNTFVADWIGKRLLAQVRAAAAAEFGRDVDIHVVVRENLFADMAATPAQAASLAAEHAVTGDPASAAGNAVALAEPAVAQRTGVAAAMDRSFTARVAPTTIGTPGIPGIPAARSPQGRPALRHSFDDFILGPNNELAAAAARRLAEEDATSHAPLFIHGACGLGKTHLLQAVCRRVLDLKPSAAVLYVTGEQFTNDFLTAVRSNRIEEFRRRIRRLDVLAVDDVHFIANKQATQQEFQHSFDAIELGGARVVLASDSHPKQINQFSAALVSRCVRGMVVEVKEPDTLTRARIVRALAERRGIPLMDTVIDVLARRCAGSVRDLEGALTKIHALASLTRLRPQASASPDAASAPIGHTLLNHFFDAQNEPAPRRAVHIDHILDAAAHVMAVPRAQITGESRQAHLVLARSLTIHLARRMTTMSYPEIALALGKRNHSTIITAAQRIERQLVDDPRVSAPGGDAPVHLSELLQRVKSRLASPGAASQ